MSNGERPSLEQILNVLKAEVIWGRTHLRIAKAIRAADPVVIHTARTFFAMTHEAHLFAAQMYAAKLHDRTRGATTIRSALTEAERVAGTFPNASAQEVRLIVGAAKAQLVEFEKILAALEDRRNEYLSHVGTETILDPTALNSKAALTIDELDHLLLETGNILNDISQGRDGTFSTLALLDSDDYATAFRLIAERKCAQANEYEKEFKKPWPHERPSICRKG